MSSERDQTLGGGVGILRVGKIKAEGDGDMLPSNRTI